MKKISTNEKWIPDGKKNPQMKKVSPNIKSILHK